MQILRVNWEKNKMEIGNIIRQQIKKYRFFYFLNEILVYFKIKYKKRILKNHLKRINSSNIIIEEDIQKSYKVISEIRPEKKQINHQHFLTKNIDLSIILPVYNSELFLDECLSSLRRQETKYKYEVICIDDGSTDKSPQILDLYKKYSNFIIIHQDNKGHSGARNVGLTMPLGRYVMFVDSDDIISENYVENMLSEAYNSGSDIVISNYNKINRKSKTLQKYRYKKNVYKTFVDYCQFDGTPWGKIYKRELWKETYFPENISFEDTIIFNILFRKSKKISICNTKRCLYYYRIYGDNTIDKLQGSCKLLDALWVVKFCLEQCEIQKVSYREDYFYYLLLQCSTHLYYRIKSFSKEIQYSVFNLACYLIEGYEKRYGFLDCKDSVLKAAQKSFKSHNFTLWVMCSTIYPHSNIKRSYFDEIRDYKNED